MKSTDRMPLCVLQGFHVNDKVLASWSDCRFYPAKVISVNKDGEYQELCTLFNTVKEHCLKWHTWFIIKVRFSAVLLFV